MKSCLDKYISAAIWPLKIKILDSTPVFKNNFLKSVTITHLTKRCNGSKK